MTIGPLRVRSDAPITLVQAGDRGLGVRRDAARRTILFCSGCKAELVLTVPVDVVLRHDEGCPVYAVLAPESA